MPGKHTLKLKKAERAGAERTARHRMAEVVDARTLSTHFLTPDAIAAGRLPQGRYIALCGQDVLPASLVEPGNGRCASCFSVPAQRARKS